MSTQTHWVALSTIARREIARILRIWTQTLIPPAITMTLSKNSQKKPQGFYY